MAGEGWRGCRSNRAEGAITGSSAPADGASSEVPLRSPPREDLPRKLRCTPRAVRFGRVIIDYAGIRSRFAVGCRAVCGSELFHQFDAIAERIGNIPPPIAFQRLAGLECHARCLKLGRQRAEVFNQ